MDRDFWLGIWERGRIPFHGAVAHPLLVRHFAALALPPGARVFVPLCGKTRDIGWLRDQGCQVVAAEISPLAVAGLFADLGLTPLVEVQGPLTRLSAPGLVVHQGDIFDLTAMALGAVDAVYDRAALIALPPAMRSRYAAHMTSITGSAPQLLLSFEDGRAPDDGPPFPVYADEIARLYGPQHRVTLIATEGPPDDQDKVWLLR